MDKTLKYYNKNAENLSKRYDSADIALIEHLLLQTFSDSNNLLELGCGSGRDANFLTQKGLNVMATDGSKKMLEKAVSTYPSLKKKLFHKILPDDLEFKEKFDGIYSIALLMHLKEEQLKTIFQKIYNLLQPNAKFIFSIPITRDGLDENGFDKDDRYFLIRDEKWWDYLATKMGFKQYSIILTNDVLDRSNIQWCTFVYQTKNGTKTGH